MAVTLPLRTDLPHYSFQTVLDGVTYGLELRFSEYDQLWHISILTAEEEPIIMGVPLVIDWPLFKRYPDTRLPPGVLMAQDTSGQRKDAGPDALGSRVLLLYFSEAEFSE